MTAVAPCDRLFPKTPQQSLIRRWVILTFPLIWTGHVTGFDRQDMEEVTWAWHDLAVSTFPEAGFSHMKKSGCSPTERGHSRERS